MEDTGEPYGDPPVVQDMTAGKARVVMLEWAEGRRSHTNVMLEMEAGVEAENRVQTLAAIAAADAQEVVKWAAVYQALAVADAARVVKARSRGLRG